MDYLHFFRDEDEFTNTVVKQYEEPWVSATDMGTGIETPTLRVNYNLTQEERDAEREKLLESPLTFEITGNGNIKWAVGGGTYKCTIEYKKNDGEWTSITSATGSSAPSISVVSGDIVQFRGDNATYCYNYINCFSGTTCQFKLSGNIMSMINSTDFATATTLQSADTFERLFYQCTGLTDASELLLPATTLTNQCYDGMFEGCTSLTTAPELPAITLADSCYYNMFQHCTSLTTAPELPTTTLNYNCYAYMFSECSSLTTAPELPATTLANQCYSNMFKGCNSLTTAPELPATALTNWCYSNMFKGCTSLTTAPELPSITLAEGCYSSMFQSCSSLTTAPELPATALTNYCYQYMFDGCSSLTTAPELPAITLADFCYNSMFFGCTNLNYIKCLATDISASSCTTRWVIVVANSGTFVKNASMSSWTTGVDGIPTNWTVQDA